MLHEIFVIPKRILKTKLEYIIVKTLLLCEETFLIKNKCTKNPFVIFGNTLYAVARSSAATSAITKQE